METIMTTIIIIIIIIIMELSVSESQHQSNLYFLVYIAETYV